MFEFLSDEWIAACDAAMRAAGPAPVEQTVRIGQVAVGTGDRGDTTDVSYTITLGPNCSVVSGIEEADVVFRQDRSLAAAIASGETTAHEAFMVGKLTVSGNPRLLVANAEASAWLHGQLAAVRDRTDWS